MSLHLDGKSFFEYFMSWLKISLPLSLTFNPLNPCTSFRDPFWKRRIIKTSFKANQNQTREESLCQETKLSFNSSVSKNRMSCVQILSFPRKKISFLEERKIEVIKNVKFSLPSCRVRCQWNINHRDLLPMRCCGVCLA